MNKRLLGIGLGLAMSMLTITCTFADVNTDILVNTAYEQLGKPYVWGSDIEDSASHDCSSLVAYCYRQLGISLPRCSYEQAYEGEEVAYEEALEWLNKEVDESSLGDIMDILGLSDTEEE